MSCWTGRIGLVGALEREGDLGRGRGIVGLLDSRLGSNGNKALLFFDLSRQGIQVEKTLLSGLAKASLRNRDSDCLIAQAEQYFESIRSIERKEKDREVREGLRTRVYHESM